jgi:hypothetical protein
MVDIPEPFIIGRDSKGIPLLPEGDIEDETGNIVHYKVKDFYNGSYKIDEEDKNKLSLPVSSADVFNYYSRKSIPTTILPGRVQIQWEHGLFDTNVPSLVKIVGEDYQPTVNKVDRTFTQNLYLQEFRELKKGSSDKIFWKNSIFKKLKEKILVAGAEFDEELTPQRFTLHNSYTIEPEESGDVFPFVVPRGTTIRVSFFVPVDIIPNKGILKLKFTRI